MNVGAWIHKGLYLSELGYVAETAPDGELGPFMGQRGALLQAVLTQDPGLVRVALFPSSAGWKTGCLSAWAALTVPRRRGPKHRHVFSKVLKAGSPRWGASMLGF